jgi:protein-L-isoaspartate(D-aspartate) O-methyltransferase
MVEHHLRRRGIGDERVLEAMARVPRHCFVPASSKRQAYADYPLPIGEAQTISQPYIVALMTEALAVRRGSKVLELGTGSGYQSAILAEMEADVWTIERSPLLCQAARTRLSELGYSRVHCRMGDGTLGLPSVAPFDRIVATGSLPSVPRALVRQLREGGIFVGPIGALYEQRLVRIAYHLRGIDRRDLGPCRFVPLIGAQGWPEGQRTAT